MKLFGNPSVCFPMCRLLSKNKRSASNYCLKKDVLGLLRTGFGKSLIYQLFPSVFETMNWKGAHVLVVSAFKAISNEQMEELNDLGIPASEVGISEQEDLKICAENTA